MPSRPLLSLLVLLLAACAGGESPADDSGDGGGADAADAATTGTLSMSFSIVPDVAAIMDEAPAGTFYGALYIEAHVTPTGVTDDAVALETFEVDLDLDPQGSPTAALFESQPLDAGLIYVLGFLDSDDSIVDDVNPDRGDPVTVPGFDDRYEVVAGASSAAEIRFDLLLP